MLATLIEPFTYDYMRNAILVSLAIPFSMLISFIVLYAMGITLNMVVLFSLTLALGNTAKAKGFNQTVEGALHLDTTDRHRGGGDRGEHDLSFQGHYQR